MGPEELVTHVIERDAHAPHKLATWIGRPARVGIRVGGAVSLDERPCRPGGDAIAILIRRDAVRCHRAFPSPFLSALSRSNIKPSSRSITERSRSMACLG